jgi:hypothetical protein
MELQPRTYEILQCFQYIDWFSSLGKPITENVVQARSLEEAFEYQNSDDWIDFWTGMSNQFRYCIRHQVGEIELKQWQVRANLIDENYIESLFPSIIGIDQLILDVRATYIWFGLEIEYAHLCFTETFPDNLFGLYSEHIVNRFNVIPPQPIASTLVYWYIRGHFPCGWIGGYPAGKLVVY